MRRLTTIRRASMVMAMTVAGLSLSGRDAAASPAYPGVVKETWALSREPECTICHATSSGGTGTVVTYFGRRMQALGVTAENPSALVQALEQDRAERTDSDGSGTTDYEDLVSGRSPNAGPGPVADAELRPEHGCTTGQGSPPPGGGLFVVTFATVAASLRRRRVRAP
jgi:MYXO-CTERM domain-containing protein